jgi:predicted amidophosphoribosyltransferase
MPFCPLCKAEYSPGTKRCPDCEIDLVEELPGGYKIYVPEDKYEESKAIKEQTVGDL